MKQLALITIVLLVPLATAAQAQEARINLRGSMIATDPPEPVAPTLEDGLIKRSTATRKTAPAVQPQRRPTRRRVGSMVGYLDDPEIASKLRLRFESALHNDTPDRVEYFYAKCGCYATLFSPGDPEYDADAPGPGPGIVEDLNFRQLYIQAEYAGGSRASVFAELPLRWVQPQIVSKGTFENQSGLGDLRAGLKLALASSPTQVVTLQVRGFLPTGDPKKGLGTNHGAVEPALLYYQQAGDRVTVETQAGFWLPVGGSAGVPTSVDRKFAGKMFFYGIGPSVEVYQQGRVSVAPVVELIGWRLLDGFQTGPADATGTNIVNIKFGARITWDGSDSIYAGYGRALTDAKWYRDIFRIEYRTWF